MTDHELLQRYAREHIQPAFTELVRRHVDLVYSAARRQVRSPHLVEEVVQIVFLELARSAEKISSAQPLAPWLYVVTRRTALNTLRSESRRLARETASSLDAMNDPSSSWIQLAPHLDEAMASLDEADRTALILRYFQNLSLREVGSMLRTSDDGAQKRLSRALDRLREKLVRRGAVPAGAAALASELSAFSVQSAPTGLAVAIVVPLFVPAAPGLLQIIASLGAPKLLAIVTTALALGFAAYEGVTVIQLRSEVRAGHQKLAQLTAAAKAARHDADEAHHALAAVNPHFSLIPPARGDHALADEISAWVKRTDLLRHELAAHPEQRIPELALLSESEWQESANGFSESETVYEADGPHTTYNTQPNLAHLRERARSNFLNAIDEAVQKYYRNTRGDLPTSFTQLAPLLPAQIDPAILARYELSNEHDRLFITEKPTGTPDPESLATFAYSAHPLENPIGAERHFETPLQRIVASADRDFSRAHGGALAIKPDQLTPFLSGPLAASQLAELFASLPFTEYRRATPKS